MNVLASSCRKPRDHSHYRIVGCGSAMTAQAEEHGAPATQISSASTLHRSRSAAPSGGRGSVRLDPGPAGTVWVRRVPRACLTPCLNSQSAVVHDAHCEAALLEKLPHNELVNRGEGAREELRGG